MRLAIVAMAFVAMLVSPLQVALADEARPIYVEVVENNNSQFLLKWKVPPVMPAPLAPAISLQHPQCTITDGATASGLIGRRLYQCDITDRELPYEVSYEEPFEVRLDFPATNPALTSLVVFKPFEQEPIQVFSGPEKTVLIIPVATSASAVAKQYTVAGIEHILVGTDHLLFVLCLMVIAGSFKRLLLTVTGFTIAHSITLSLATLNIVRLPTELVELLIALSIVLLAVEIIKHRRADSTQRPSFTWRYPVSASSAFGLLHGFGFAVVLQELGLPTAMKAHALLFFNIGVELGQLLFIAVVLALVFLGLRAVAPVRQYRALLTDMIIYTVGIVSSYWLFERFAALF
ncbi:MAG: HupE/UreJ family protein [Porticoccaceae bacterium]|nr:HupE/UreJ family protein [Porticoccaceae bacterium]